LWLHSLKVAQLLRSAACSHTNQSRSYLNHLVAVLDRTIKEAYLRDVAIPNSNSLHSTIAKKLQKYTDLKEELTRK